MADIDASQKICSSTPSIRESGCCFGLLTFCRVSNSWIQRLFSQRKIVSVMSWSQFCPVCQVFCSKILRMRKGAIRPKGSCNCEMRLSRLRLCNLEGSFKAFSGVVKRIVSSDTFHWMPITRSKSSAANSSSTGLLSRAASTFSQRDRELLHHLTILKIPSEATFCSWCCTDAASSIVSNDAT